MQSAMLLKHAEKIPAIFSAQFARENPPVGGTKLFARSYGFKITALCNADREKRKRKGCTGAWLNHHGIKSTAQIRQRVRVQTPPRPPKILVALSSRGPGHWLLAETQVRILLAPPKSSNQKGTRRVAHRASNAVGSWFAETRRVPLRCGWLCPLSPWARARREGK